MKSHFADEERLQRHGETILRFADGFGKASVSSTPFLGSTPFIIFHDKFNNENYFNRENINFERVTGIKRRSYPLAL
jgi:hypothetical protein